MKNIISYCIFILLLPQYSNAQHEYDIWYFGFEAGINFHSGNPVVLTDGQTQGFEGIACISDSPGNFLFSATSTVLNRQQQMMDHGNNLHGGGSSTQGDLILPLPGSDSIYFIFTVGPELQYGFQYSIVDISLNAGNGKVIAKNIQVQNSVTEKLTAARDANGIDYWVIVHGWNSNSFYAYKFSSTGLDTNAVVSNVGQIHGSNLYDECGYMKTSHKGKKIALAVLTDNFFELFDFSDSTGIVSHELLLSSPLNSIGAYGIEFSPDDNKLYATLDSPGTLLQWDISSGNDSIINSSMISLPGFVMYDHPGDIQLAPDGKIYMSIEDKLFLGVINDPDEAGTNCNFVDSGFNVSPGFLEYGLPNIFPGALQIPVTPESNFATNAESICEKFCVNFFDLTLDSPTVWLWLFPGGDPSSSTLQNPTNICYSSSGAYDVTLITSNANGSDTLTLHNYITVHPTPPIPTITQVGYTLTSSSASSYQWQFNSYNIPGATNQSYDVLQTGYYTVLVSDENGCVNSTTTYVLISGIDDANGDANILISPNPSSGNFTVELLNDLMADNVSIEVVNTIGLKVFSAREKISTSVRKKEIDLSNIAPGVYFIEIKSENIFVTKKIVISY